MRSLRAGARRPPRQLGRRCGNLARRDEPLTSRRRAGPRTRRDHRHRRATTDTATFALAPRAATVGFGPQGADAWTVPGPEEQTAVVKGPRRRWGAGTVGFLGKLLVIGAVLAVLAGVGYGAYMTLPTATVHLQPETQTFGPQVFHVVADPAVAVSDPETGRMPAETVTLPLSETGTFNATGQAVTLVPATGTVEFTSTNTDQDVSIPDGTIVSTRDGTAVPDHEGGPDSQGPGQQARPDGRAGRRRSSAAWPATSRSAG